MKTTHTIIFKDSSFMKELEDNSVHLIITSPPYGDRKDYNHPDQIGFGQTYKNYLNDLNQIWQECYRVLHSGCKLCIIIGDLFTRTKEFGRYKIIPIHANIITSCEKIGFDLINIIIWQKITRCHPSGGCSLMGSIYYPRNGIVSEDFEYILIFKKLGKQPKVSKEIKEKSKLSLKEWVLYFNGHWNITGDKDNNHPATFPLEIPYRLIRMYSFVGETVLDPFLGSGTTVKAARILLRNSIGYEINKNDYWTVIQEKVGLNQSDLFHQYKWKIIDG